jgi:hypothetical protein
LVGWLVDWLAGWLAGWLVGWLAGWLIGWLVTLAFSFMGNSEQHVYLNRFCPILLMLHLYCVIPSPYVSVLDVLGRWNGLVLEGVSVFVLLISAPYLFFLL